MIPLFGMQTPSNRDGNKVPSRQWEIHHGANPATNPGAATRKIADLASANTFLIHPITPGRSAMRDG